MWLCVVSGVKCNEIASVIFDYYITVLNQVQVRSLVRLLLKLILFSICFNQGIDYTVMFFDKANYGGHVNDNLQCNDSALHLSVITSIIRSDLMVFLMMSINGF